jgi:hypothetical protein
MSELLFASFHGDYGKNPSEGYAISFAQDGVLVFTDHLLWQSFEVHLNDASDRHIVRGEARRFPITSGSCEVLEMAMDAHRGQRGDFRHAQTYPRFWESSSNKHDFFYKGEGGIPEAEIWAVIWEETGFELSQAHMGDYTEFRDPYTESVARLPENWFLPQFARWNLTQRYVGDSHIWPVLEQQLHQAMEDGVHPDEIWKIGFLGYAVFDEFGNYSLQDYQQFIPEDMWKYYSALRQGLEAISPNRNSVWSDVVPHTRVAMWGLLSQTQHWLAAHSPQSLRDVGWRRCCEAAYRGALKQYYEYKWV